MRKAIKKVVYRRKRRKTFGMVLNVAKEIAKKRQGALFVIALEKRFRGKYDTLYPQIIKESARVSDQGMERVLEKMATLDGAVLISTIGKIIAYGARIKKIKSIKGFGTRHAAALGASLNIKNSTAILVSEELNWIRIFKRGNIVLEMDAHKLPPNIEKKVVKFLSSGDKAFIAALVGGGAVAGLLGSPLIAPIIIVGGTYVAIKTAAGLIKERLSNSRRKKKKIRKSKRGSIFSIYG